MLEPAFPIEPSTPGFGHNRSPGSGASTLNICIAGSKCRFMVEILRGATLQQPKLPIYPMCIQPFCTSRVPTMLGCSYGWHGRPFSIACALCVRPAVFAAPYEYTYGNNAWYHCPSRKKSPCICQLNWGWTGWQLVKLSVILDFQLSLLDLTYLSKCSRFCCEGYE